MQHVTGGRDLFLAFDEETHAPALDDRHLLVWMIVLGSHQKRLVTKTTDHHAVADEHLSLDSLGRVLDGNLGPVQMLSEVGTVAVAVVLRKSGRHFVSFYFLSLTASRPDPPAAYSGCTFTTPYRRSSPSLIAAIIQRKLICPPGAAT